MVQSNRTVTRGSLIITSPRFFLYLRDCFNYKRELLYTTNVIRSDSERAHRVCLLRRPLFSDFLPFKGISFATLILQSHTFLRHDVALFILNVINTEPKTKERKEKKAVISSCWLRSPMTGRRRWKQYMLTMTVMITSMMTTTVFVDIAPLQVSYELKVTERRW